MKNGSTLWFMEEIKLQVRFAAAVNTQIKDSIAKKDYCAAIVNCLKLPHSKNLFNAAILSMHLGNLDDAALYFENALQVDPWLTIGHYMYAVLMQRLGQYEMAIKLYDYCIISFRGKDVIEYEQIGLYLTMNKCDAFLNKACCHQLLGEFDFAVDEYQNAKELNSNINTLFGSLGRAPRHSDEMPLFFQKRNFSSKSNHYLGHVPKIICSLPLKGLMGGKVN